RYAGNHVAVLEINIVCDCVGVDGGTGLDDVLHDGGVVAIDEVGEIGGDPAAFIADHVALVTSGLVAKKNLAAALPIATGNFLDLTGCGFEGIGVVRPGPRQQDSAQLQCTGA